nr:hypothetical protein [uncultured Draconibacterium sp.]
MKKVTFVLSLVLVFGVSLSVKAVAKEGDKVEHNVKVKIPQYALVGLSSTDDITLYPEAPTTAGMDLDFTGDHISDDSKWLNYSYLGSSKDKATSISVKLENDGDPLPVGIGIGLKVGTYNGNGKGSHGEHVNAGEMELSTNSTVIVKNIKNCYTGTGTQGHQLTYTLKKKGDIKYSELVAGDYSVRVVYTITD